MRTEETKTQELREKAEEQRRAKQRLRLALLEKRSKIDPGARCAWDSRIALELLRLPEYQNAGLLLTFLSTPQELSTRILIAHALGLGKVVAVPRWGGGQMEFCPFTDYEELRPGQRGILQPPEGVAPLTDFRDALCLVPALAVDRRGLRIGYGGGYYDRFLAHFPGSSVVPAYEEMLWEALPAEPHDRPVGAIITPEGVIRILQREGTGEHP